MSPPCLDTFLIPCSLSSSSSCHWSQVFVNFANLPRTSIPCYLCHPRRRRLPPLRVVYASALSSMSLLVDSRLSRLKSSIFACSSRGSVFYLHTHLAGFNSSPYRYHYLRSTSLPSVVHPAVQPVFPCCRLVLRLLSSPATRRLYSLRRLRTQWGSGSSLVRYQYPSLIVFAYGARGPLQYTHVYRRRLCPVVAVPLPCRRLLSLAVYARDKVSRLWNLLRLYLVLASSSSLSLLVLCHHGLEDPSKTSSQALHRFPCLCRCFVTMGLETPTKLHPSSLTPRRPSQPVTSYFVHLYRVQSTFAPRPPPCRGLL